MGKKKKSSSSSSSSSSASTSTSTTTSSTSASPSTSNEPETFNPFSNINEKELASFEDFKKRTETLTLDDREKKLITDMMIFRYLRARDYDVDASFELFTKSLEWRKVYRPHDITPEELTIESFTGKVYCNGFTKGGRPVIYMRPTRENTKDHEQQIRLLVYTIEKAVSLMEEHKGVEQLAIFIDFNGYSLKHMPPMSQSKLTLDILSSHYPERLGVAFVVDPPLIFNVFWNLISPFINKVTARKIVFVSGEKQKQKLLPQYFDMEQLENAFGGSSGFEYEHMAVWKKEIENYRQKHNLDPLSEDQMLEILEKGKKAKDK